MDIQKLNERGTYYYNNHQYEKALDCYEEILKIDEHNIIALKNKTLILTEIGNLAEALENVEKEIKIKKTWENLNNKGNILNLLNRIPEAIIYYNKALEIDSKNEEVLYNKAISLINLSDFELAIECLNKIKETTEIIHLKADTLMQLNKIELAINYYERILKINPNDTDVLNNKGVAFSRINKFKDALSCYDKALKIDSKKEELWVNKAQILSKLNKYDEAIECFDFALELNPKNKIIWLYKSDCYIELNNEKKAEICFEKYYK